MRAKSVTSLVIVVSSVIWVGVSAQQTQPAPASFSSHGVSRSSRTRSAAAVTPTTAWPRRRVCIFRIRTQPRKRSRRSVSRSPCSSTEADPSRSLLLNKPTNRERHTGGVRIQTGSFDGRRRCATGCVISPAFPRTTVTAAREQPPPEATVRAGPAPAAADAQPVQQHGARSARRLQPPGRSVSARRLRQRLQEPDRARRVCRRCWRRPTAPRPRQLAQNAFRGGDDQRLIPCKPASREDVSAATFVRSFGLRRSAVR